MVFYLRNKPDLKCEKLDKVVFQERIYHSLRSFYEHDKMWQVSQLRDCLECYINNYLRHHKMRKHEWQTVKSAWKAFLKIQKWPADYYIYDF